MSYLGKTPSQGTRNRFYFTASGGETSLSGADDNGNTLTFADGAFVDVSVNGISLVAGTDYNTTTANTIGGLTALVASDVVEIVAYDVFNIFSGSVSGTLNVSETVTASAFSGDGSALTGIPSPTLTSLGIANHDQVTVTAGGAVTSTSFAGDGSSLTTLNASNLGSGTIPDARFPATLPAVNGSSLTALNASNLGSGTLPDARFPATLPAVSGANLTNLPASGNFTLLTNVAPTTSPTFIDFTNFPAGVDTFLVAYSIRIASTLSDDITFRFLDASNSQIANQCYNTLRTIQKTSAVGTITGTGSGGATSILITPDTVHFGNDRGGVKGYFWMNGMNSDYDASTSSVFPSIVGQCYMDANIPGSSSSTPAFGHYGGSMNETAVTTFSRTGPSKGFRLLLGNGFGTGSVISVYSVTQT